MPTAPFNRQLIRLQFPKDIHWGDDVTIWISKTGDIARTMYLRVTWPSDAPTTVQPSAGTAMIDRIELSYKDQLIERIYGENLYMLHDITIPQAKQLALSNLVGRNTTTALSSYHIPLPFFILKKGLPLLALKEPPRFRVVFKPSNFFTTSVYTKPIDVSLFVEYVYVTKAERDWFLKNEIIYMTQTFQRVQFQVPVTAAQTTYTYYTEFVNDVKELFWVIQSDTSSNVYDYGTTDHLSFLRLRFNGVDRITPDYASPQYLRVVQGLQFHTRVPDGLYYMYTFSLEPESDQPTGGVNMSHILRQQHDLTLTAHASTRSLRLYATSYNLMRVKDGEAKMLYTEREGGNVPVTTLQGGQVGIGIDPYVRGTGTVNGQMGGGGGGGGGVPGTVQWAARLAGTDTDVAQGIDVDSSGNVYLSGYYISNPLTLYNSDGNSSGITLPNSGSWGVYVAKYDTTGTSQWAARLEGTSYENAQDVAVDSSGNVCVTGSYQSNPLTLYNSDGNSSGITLSNSGFNDVYVAKYNTTGTAQWAARLAGSSNDTATGVSVDSSGNVCVTGSYQSNPLTLYNSDGNSSGITLSNSGSYDVYVAKYNTTGTAQWAARIAGTSIDIAQGIAVESSGNVYVTGSYQSNPLTLYNSDGNSSGITLPKSGSYDGYVAKYNTSGTVQWAARLTNGNTVVIQGVAVDSSGNVYVTGRYLTSTLTFYNSDGNSSGITLPSSGSYDVYVAKYNRTGTAQWAARLASTDNDTAIGVSVDGSGNVYLTGYYESDPLTLYNSDGNSSGITLPNTSGGSSVYMTKYNTSGTVQWAARLSDTSLDYAGGVAVDNSGNVYFNGYYDSNPLIFYNSDGNSSGITLPNPSGSYDVYVVKYLV
jgi:hypothetical protein